MSQQSAVRRWEERLGIREVAGPPEAPDLGECALRAVSGEFSTTAQRVVREGLVSLDAEIAVIVRDGNVECAFTRNGLPVRTPLRRVHIAARRGHLGDMVAPVYGVRGWRYVIAACDQSWIIVAGPRVQAKRAEAFARLCGTLWQLERERQQERDAAQIDPTTGLYNRRGFEQRTAQGPRSAVVVYADLDDLKVVNDREGHEAGDRLLRATAAVLRATLRERDLAARMGGDEFAVVAYGEQADVVLRRLRGAFARAQIRCSFGAAAVPDDAESIAEAIARADARMYEDKVARKGAAR